MVVVLPEILAFEPAHATGGVELILPIQQLEFGVPVSLSDQPDLQDIAHFYQRGCGNFWVALANDEVVGSVGLRYIGHGQTALRKMFVKATHRGAEHGVARGLLAQFVDWCTSHAAREDNLSTAAKFLAAHRFHEKNGFCEIPRSELPEAFPVMVVDTRDALK